MPNNAGLNFSQELQNTTISQNVNYNNLAPIIPDASNPTLIATVPLANYITDDYFHHPRNNNTNIGAVESSVSTNTSSIESNNLMIYPNPTSNKLFFNQKLRAQNISIYDLQGKRLFEKTNFSGNEIDISKIKSGVYLLVISDNKIEVKRYKFIIL